MKILIASDLYTPAVNGVVTSIINLKNELSKKGHDVRVLTLGQDNFYDPIAKTYTVSSYDIHKVYPGARFALPPIHSKCRGVLEWQPDVIHTQSEFSIFYMAWRISRELEIPIVHTYHTMYEDYTHYLIKSELVGKKAVKLFTRFILDASEKVVVPTYKIKDLLEEYGVKQDLEVIPTGIDLDKFQRSNTETENSRQALLDKHQLPTNAFLILYIGRIGYEKNIQEIIRYFNRLQRTDMHLIIGGGGPYASELKSIVEDLNIQDRVSFTGMIDPNEVQDYYQLADIFVSASTSETQGLTYIESLASGTPIVCREDSATYHVIENGVNGFQYSDFDGFKAGIFEILKDKETHQRYRDQAVQSAFEFFGAETFAEDIFNKVYLPAIDSYDPDLHRKHPFDIFV